MTKSHQPAPHTIDVATMSKGEIRSVVAAASAEAMEVYLTRTLRDLDVVREAALASSGVMTRHMVASLLGVCTDTVAEYVRSSDLPCHRPGKAPLFLREEVEAWVGRFDQSGQILDVPATS